MKEITIRNILLGLIIIYLLQGILYENGSIISQTTILLYLGICLVYYIKINLKKNNPKFIISLSIFIMIVPIYYIFGTKSYFMGKGIISYTSNYIKLIGFALLSFYPFYYFSNKNQFTKKTILCFYAVYLIVILLQYYHSFTGLIIQNNRNDNVNNASYSIISLFPLINLFINRKILAYSLLFIFTFLVVISFKRGPIIINALLLIMFYIHSIKQGKKFSRVINITISTCAFLLITYYIYHIYLTNEYLQLRMMSIMQGNGSGRDIIYQKILDYWLDKSNILQQLFGNGLWYSVAICGNYAHNDWLEILSNFGIFGIAIYTMIFISLFNIAKKMKTNSEIKYAFIMIFTIWFMRSLFSMGYMEYDHVISMVLLGYILGKIYKHNSNMETLLK